MLGLMIPIGHDDRPAFEIVTRSGWIYRIYASGRTEGFVEAQSLTNNIPRMIGDAVQYVRLIDKQERDAACKEAIARAEAERESEGRAERAKSVRDWIDNPSRRSVGVDLSTQRSKSD